MFAVTGLILYRHFSGKPVRPSEWGHAWLVFLILYVILGGVLNVLCAIKTIQPVQLYYLFTLMMLDGLVLLRTRFRGTSTRSGRSDKEILSEKEKDEKKTREDELRSVARNAILEEWVKGEEKLEELFPPEVCTILLDYLGPTKTPTGQKCYELQHLQRSVTAVCAGPNGLLAVAGNYYVELFNALTDEKLLSEQAASTAHSVVILDTTLLIVCGEPQTKVWDLTKLPSTTKPKFEISTPAKSVVLPNTRQLVVFAKNSVDLWSLDTGTRLKEIIQSGLDVSAVTALPEFNPQFAVATYSGVPSPNAAPTDGWFAVAVGSELRLMSTNGMNIPRPCLSSAPNGLVALSDNRMATFTWGSLKIFSLDSRSLTFREESQFTATESISSVAELPNGDIALGAKNDVEIKGGGRFWGGPKAADGPITALAVLSNGLLAVAHEGSHSRDGSKDCVVVWC